MRMDYMDGLKEEIKSWDGKLSPKELRRSLKTVGEILMFESRLNEALGQSLDPVNPCVREAVVLSRSRKAV